MSWYLTVIKKYAEFGGRARRMEYWMFTLVNTVIQFLLFIPAIAVLALQDSEEPSILALLLMAPVFIYVIAMIIPSLAVAVRRFHDQDRSGWFLLVSFVPFVGGLIFLIMMCLEGTSGPNRFGADPLRPDAEGSDVWPDVA